MADPFHHALSSVKAWGGELSAYLPVHQWLDESKMLLSDPRHRALRHHSEGVEVACRVFGQAIDNGAGRMIPVRWICERHIVEDLGYVPSAVDWLRAIRPEPWMNKPRKLSRELERQDHEQAGIDQRAA